jgi:hypothetical protein
MEPASTVMFPVLAKVIWQTIQCQPTLLDTHIPIIFYHPSAKAAVIYTFIQYLPSAYWYQVTLSQ